MIVTRIEDISKAKCRIFVDDNFAFVLYKGEIRLYKLKEQEEISEETQREILEEVLVKRAKLRCMNLLKARPYTENQLLMKLKQGEYPEEVAKKALDYVRSYGYIDDRQYAEDYIVNQQAKKSLKVIREDLLRKGIERGIIAEACENLERTGDVPDEEALARKWLAGKRYDSETADFKEKQKIAAFLYRKGISGEVIRRVLNTDFD